MEARSENMNFILCNLAESLGSFAPCDGISVEQLSDKQHIYLRKSVQFYTVCSRRRTVNFDQEMNRPVLYLKGQTEACFALRYSAFLGFLFSRLVFTPSLWCVIEIPIRSQFSSSLPCLFSLGQSFFSLHLTLSLSQCQGAYFFARASHSLSKTPTVRSFPACQRKEASRS